MITLKFFHWYNDHVPFTKFTKEVASIWILDKNSVQEELALQLVS